MSIKKKFRILFKQIIEKIFLIIYPKPYSISHDYKIFKVKIKSDKKKTLFKIFQITNCKIYTDTLYNVTYIKNNMILISGIVSHIKIDPTFLNLGIFKFLGNSSLILFGKLVILGFNDFQYLNKSLLLLFIFSVNIINGSFIFFKIHVLIKNDSNGSSSSGLFGGTYNI